MRNYGRRAEGRGAAAVALQSLPPWGRWIPVKLLAIEPEDGRGPLKMRFAPLSVQRRGANWPGTSSAPSGHLPQRGRLLGFPGHLAVACCPLPLSPGGRRPHPSCASRNPPSPKGKAFGISRPSGRRLLPIAPFPGRSALQLFLLPTPYSLLPHFPLMPDAYCLMPYFPNPLYQTRSSTGSLRTRLTGSAGTPTGSTHTSRYSSGTPRRRASWPPRSSSSVTWPSYQQLS